MSHRSLVSAPDLSPVNLVTRRGFVEMLAAGAAVAAAGRLAATPTLISDPLWSGGTNQASSAGALAVTATGRSHAEMPLALRLPGHFAERIPFVTADSSTHNGQQLQRLIAEVHGFELKPSSFRAEVLFTLHEPGGSESYLQVAVADRVGRGESGGLTVACDRVFAAVHPWLLASVLVSNFVHK